MLAHAVGLRAETHRLTTVDHQHHLQIRFLFVFLDVILVGSSEYPPVDMPEVVALSVGTMRRELYRYAAMRAAVHPAEKSFDHHACPQIQTCYFRKKLGVKVTR